MSILMVLAAAVAAVDILLLLPVRLSARYAAGAFSLTVSAGPVAVLRAPGARERKAARDGRPRRGTRRIAPAVLLRAALRCRDRARKMARRVRVDALRLHFIAGGDDPYRAAMAYARAGAALEGIRGLAAGRAGRTDLCARADMDGGQTALDGGVDLTVRLGTLVGAAVCFGTALLREYFRYQRERE